TTRRPSTPKTPKTKATSTPVLVDVKPTKPTLVDDDEMNTHSGTSGEGCLLEGKGDMKLITAYTGDSVVLPCSCTDLHITPGTLIWRKYPNVDDFVEISPESEQYKGRVQLFNAHSPGNLSLLISNLTVEDGGWYRCRISNSNFKDISVEVKDRHPNTINIFLIIIIISSSSSVVMLLVILGGVIYWKHIDQKQGQTKINDGQKGQKTQKTEQIHYTLNPALKSIMQHYTDG
ncbi:polymeric immunoglobulin receptor-like, partial [Clarias magur]